MDEEFGSEARQHMKERLYELREMIDDHIEEIHKSVTENAKKTLKFIQIMQINNKNIRQRPISTDIVRLDPSMFAVRRLWDQVASANDSSKANDFDVDINYQLRAPRSKKSKEQQTTESAKQNKDEKSRITKGEEEEITARIIKGDDQKIMARISRSDEQSDENSSPSSTVKLILVNAKIDRFKRKTKTKTANGKMVNRPL